MQLRKEIADRQEDLNRLMTERHEREVLLEKEKDRYVHSENDLATCKQQLHQKRIEVEKMEALKETTTR